jgi:hypothetical protein
VISSQGFVHSKTLFGPSGAPSQKSAIFSTALFRAGIVAKVFLAIFSIQIFKAFSLRKLRGWQEGEKND